MSDEQQPVDSAHDHAATEPARKAALVPGAYRILEPVCRHHEYDVDDLGRRLQHALSAFPVLADHTITVARDNPERDRTACAYAWTDVIAVQDDEYQSNVTLYHELGHLAIYWRIQNGEAHPTTSEEYCSIFAAARMPPERVDEARVPYLGEVGVPREAIPDRCREALAYREDHHDYIQHCRRLLEVDDAGD